MRSIGEICLWRTGVVAFDPSLNTVFVKGVVLCLTKLS